jgi:predicted DCC family thiol-disulfide oxidoreductase YuxK
MIPWRIILFDGYCNLCSGIVQFIIRRDKFQKFGYSPLQTEFGIQLLKQFGYRDSQLDFVIYLREGKCFTRSSAILMILKDLGGWWRLYYGFIIIPKSIRDFFYNTIAKRRYRLFGRTDHCIVPSPEIRQQFLD